MKSRTSFFNPTVFRKDITRFAPAWALYLIGGILVALNVIASPDNGSQTAYGLFRLLPLSAFVNLVYGLINAQLLFGDLLNRKLCNALHAMPVRRETWFFSHYVSGLLFSLVPNALLCGFVALFMGDFAPLVLLWLLAITGQYLFFFSAAVFCATCTGQRFAGVALYGLVNFLSLLVMWFVNSFYIPLLKGITVSNDLFYLFSPAIRLIGHEGNYVQFGRYYENSFTRYYYIGLGDSWVYLLAAVGAGIVFSALAVLLYRRRKLERAGDFMAFGWLEPVFSVLLTLCAGAFLQLLFGSGFQFVGFFIGFFVSQMLLQRRVNVFKKRTFITLGIFTAVMVLTLVLTILDPLGLTRWSPKVQQVKTVTLTADYNFDPRYNDPYHVITLEDDASIEDIIEVHDMLIREGFSGQSEQLFINHSTSRQAVTLVYTLEDGRTVRRSYYYDTDSRIAAALKKFYSRPEYIMGFSHWEHFIENTSQVSVNGHSVYADQAKGLLEALKADCEAGSVNVYGQGYSEILFFVEFRYDDQYRNVAVRYANKNTVEYVNTYIPDWNK